MAHILNGITSLYKVNLLPQNYFLLVLTIKKTIVSELWRRTWKQLALTSLSQMFCFMIVHLFALTLHFPRKLCISASLIDTDKISNQRISWRLGPFVSGWTMELSLLLRIFPVHWKGEITAAIWSNFVLKILKLCCLKFINFKCTKKIKCFYKLILIYIQDGS